MHQMSASFKKNTANNHVEDNIDAYLGTPQPAKNKAGSIDESDIMVESMTPSKSINDRKQEFQ